MNVKVGDTCFCFEQVAICTEGEIFINGRRMKAIHEEPIAKDKSGIVTKIIGDKIYIKELLLDYQREFREKFKKS